jgi:hypothetical protein
MAVVGVAGIECSHNIQVDNQSKKVHLLNVWSCGSPMSRTHQPESTINDTGSLDSRQVQKPKYLLQSDTIPEPRHHITLP